ncbi:MAG: LysM peptidoglycan-binding domain-containing protein [Planctomycetaceae bacterium]|nr:LysM peptidoglycan-binding domain-containing protein [Planctomycetaceae bacterium]
MKIVKRIAVALVLCLAVVGAFALLKKAPQLNVPPEDIHYLEEVGISASESATDEGLSGAHGSVQGVPPLVSPSQIQGSNTPPSAFGVSSPLSASVPLLPTAGSEIPALTAKTEAPSFTVSSEAPPFVAANPEPVTAAPFVVPTLPQAAPTPSVPFQPVPTTQSVPLQPVPTQIPIPPPVQPPPPDKPVTWDGPITEVVFIPSTDVSDPWRVSGVIERPTEPSELLPKPVDPFLAFAVSAPVPSLPSTDSTNSTELLTHAGQETALPNNLPNNSNNNNFQVNKNKVAVSGDRIKRLPTVAEKTPEMKQTVTVPIDFEKNTPLFSAAIPVSVPIDSQKRLYSQTLPLPEEKYPPFKLNDYRQTSIRSDIAFVPVLPSVKEEQPMISFVQQKPEKFAVKETIPLATILPAKLETEIPFTDTKPMVPETVTEVKAIDSIPFVAIESSPAAPTIEIPAQQTAPMIRETVGRFIKAQTVLIESGEAAKIRNAFVQLSRLYEHQELNEAEKAYMLPLLDRLALNVIYSRNAHILEPAYIIRLGDSVDSIAQTFDLSSALLMKINGLTGARPLEPGTELKVVVGHFDAKISAGHRELTLILGGLYAGRFPVALGERIEHLRGEFYVSSKTDAWNEKSLTLNNGVVFYGTDRPQPGDPLATTVRFTQQDAKELLDILTERSVIVFGD